MDTSTASCHTPRRRWMAWMPFATMGLLLLVALAYPPLVKHPWGLALLGVVALSCPAMCFVAMFIQAHAGRR